MYSYPVWHESCPFTATALFDLLIFEFQMSLANARSCQENKKTKPFASQCSTCSSSILRPYPNFPPNPICCCLFCFFLPYSHRLSEVSLRPPPGVIRFGKQSLDFLSIRVCATDGNGDFEMVSGCTRPIVFHQVPNYLLQADIVCSDRLHLIGESPQLRRRLWVVACCVVCEYRPDLLFGEETGKRLLAIYGILLGRILGGGRWG